MTYMSNMNQAPSSTRPTMADVARAAGVSPSTVDRVLNARVPVRSDTASRIHEAAQALGYHPVGVIRACLQDERPRRTLGFLLQQRSSAFYGGLADALGAATQASPDMQGRAVVEFLADMAPQAACTQLEQLAKSCDALALVAADHPRISETIARLRAQGKPVFALVSNLDAAAHAGYAGLDNRRVGRTAAWFITRQARQAGPIGIFVGSHRYQCQELCEMSFRSYVREHAPDFELLEPVVTLESDHYAQEAARDLLQRHPDLVGVYVGGGGIDGVLQALRDHVDSQPTMPLVAVAHDLTPTTREALVNGYLQAVLSHPLPQLAERLVSAMAQALEEPLRATQQIIVPFDIHTPESV